MPADYSKIEQYKEEAANKTYAASGAEAAAGTLWDNVMGAVRTDRQSRGVSKLATDVGNVMGQMVSDPNAIREGPESLSAQGLVDPFSINQLTSNARAQNLRTLGTISTQETANQGTIDQVIQAGANQLFARADMLKAEATKSYNEALGLQSEWERDLAERKFAADEEEKNKPKAGKKEKEKRPRFTPRSGEGATSPGGEYIYYNGVWMDADELTLLENLFDIGKKKKDLEEGSGSGIPWGQ